MGNTTMRIDKALYADFGAVLGNEIVRIYACALEQSSVGASYYCILRRNQGVHALWGAHAQKNEMLVWSLARRSVPPPGCKWLCSEPARIKGTPACISAGPKTVLFVLKCVSVRRRGRRWCWRHEDRNARPYLETTRVDRTDARKTHSQHTRKHTRTCVQSRVLFKNGSASAPSDTITGPVYVYGNAAYWTRSAAESRPR